MKMLIDLDSILYKSVYRIISFSQIKEALTLYGKEAAKQWLMETVYNEGVNRTENELLKMQNYINDVFFEDIDSYELFITTCSKSFRKEIRQDYKANRKRNNYVWLIREHYRNNGAIHSDTHEADDLIANRTRELGHGNYIVVTMDKDLKQLGGHYWSYYTCASKNMDGSIIEDEFGNSVKEYKQKNVEYISKDEADLFFWGQMLTGDPGDNIKGVIGIGPAKAKKILETSNNRFISVARQYIAKGQKKDFYDTYKLLKLG